MARTKKTLLPGLAECMKPLDANKNVSMYIATHCQEPGHDKVYIFVVVLLKKRQYLARFWGKYGATLSGMYDQLDPTGFQKLIDQKGAEGYKIIDNQGFADDSHIWAPYAHSIAQYVKTMPVLTAGTKTIVP